LFTKFRITAKKDTWANPSLPKNLPLSKKLNPALIFGARAAGQSRNHFATARTGIEVSHRKKLKSPSLNRCVVRLQADEERLFLRWQPRETGVSGD
jgi:hypothetical protein